MKLARLLIDRTEYEVSLRNFGWGRQQAFSVWQQCLEPFYYQKPDEERIDMALCFAMNLIHPGAVRRSLALDRIPPLVHWMRSSRGQTLLGLVAYNTARLLKIFLSRDAAYLKDHVIGMFVTSAVQHIVE